MLTNLFDYLAGSNFAALAQARSVISSKENSKLEDFYRDFKEKEQNIGVKGGELSNIASVQTMTLAEFKAFLNEKPKNESNAFALSSNSEIKVYQICIDQNKITSSDFSFLFNSIANLSPANILVNSNQAVNLDLSFNGESSQYKISHKDEINPQAVTAIACVKKIKELSAILKLFSSKAESKRIKHKLNNIIVVISSTSDKSELVLHSILEKIAIAYNSKLIEAKNQKINTIITVALIGLFISTPAIVEYFK